MITLVSITTFLVLIYFLYPWWLSFQHQEVTYDAVNDSVSNEVTVIYFSYNGIEYLKTKISSILNQLHDFQTYELIIVDDGSTDGSQKILSGLEDKNIKLILKSESKGLIDSMNRAVKEAKFDQIVFCDQRQFLLPGILKKLISPLGENEIGAVSACISSTDKSRCISILRSHENRVKRMEGNVGSLIGVYGPLYAINRKYYKEIPKEVILDDLYLSIEILKLKRIVFMECCQIIENDFHELYNYQRVKRYLKGLMQIICNYQNLTGLTSTQLKMLIWHKYLRLLIPILISASVISIGVTLILKISQIPVYLLLASTFLVLATSIALKIRKINIIGLSRVILFYSVAIVDVLFSSLFKRKTYKYGS